MNLVMIPFHDWKKCEREGFRTRDAHFMQEFGEHPLVDKLLVINRPISVAEIVLLRRNWRVKHGKPLVRKKCICISQVADKTFTLDIIIPEVLRPVLMRRNWIPYIFAQSRMAQAVAYSLDYLNMKESYALFTSAPLFVPLVQHLSPSVFVLDALDNLLKHASYRDVPKLDEYYEFCQDQADLIFANSPETTHWLAQKRPDATCVPNGVDIEIFTPSHSYPLPSDMTSIPRPIVGYAGKMQEMFDTTLMERVITEMPGVKFVFIGQQLNLKWVKHLWQHANVHYLGDKPYELLPHYLAAFDVCIIPYSMDRQHGVDPIKFYEYLAMGKPVVTTDVGGVRAFRDYSQVRIAQTDTEFIKGLSFFLEQLQVNTPIEVRSLPVECLWRTKANQMLDAINQNLQGNSPHSIHLGKDHD